MTSEDVTMFRKQLILLKSREIFIFVLFLLSFRFSYFLSLSSRRKQFFKDAFLSFLCPSFLLFFWG